MLFSFFHAFIIFEEGPLFCCTLGAIASCAKIRICARQWEATTSKMATRAKAGSDAKAPIAAAKHSTPLLPLVKYFSHQTHEPMENGKRGIAQEMLCLMCRATVYVPLCSVFWRLTLFLSLCDLSIHLPICPSTNSRLPRGSFLSLVDLIWLIPPVVHMFVVCLRPYAVDFFKDQGVKLDGMPQYNIMW